MSTVYLTTGDITRTVPIEAIVTLINSGDMWYGGVDGAIQRIAGGQYHAKARKVLNINGLHNGEVVIAKQTQRHLGTFKDVIFVVDDLQSPLNELVFAALNTAESEGYQSIAMPLMRTGRMLGVVESTVNDVVHEMLEGIDRFNQNNPASHMTIIIVVYGDPNAVRLLGKTVPLLPDSQ